MTTSIWPVPQGLTDQASEAQDKANNARWRINHTRKYTPHLTAAAQERAEALQAESTRLHALIEETRRAQAAEFSAARIGSAVTTINQRIANLRTVLSELEDIADQITSDSSALSTRILLETLRATEVSLIAAAERAAGELDLVAVPVSTE